MKIRDLLDFLRAKKIAILTLYNGPNLTLCNDPNTNKLYDTVQPEIQRMLQLKKEIENRAPTIEDVEELAKLYIKIIESHWLKTPGSPSPDIITAEMLRICEDCVELIESIIPNLQTQSDSYGEDTHLYEVVKCWISIAEVRRTIWRHLRQNGDKVNDCYQKAWEIAKLENFEAHPGVGALHDATEQLLLWIGEFARAGK